MPIPKPRKNERRGNFMNRCMGNATMNAEFPDSSQRAAVCNTQWRNRNRKKDICMSKLHKKILETKAEFQKFWDGMDFTDDQKEMFLVENEPDQLKIHAGVVIKEEDVEEDEENGQMIIKGYASTSDRDRVLDVITDQAQKKAAKTLMKPGTNTVLFNHDTDMPIGKCLDSRFNKKGIFVKDLISSAPDVKSIRIKLKEGILNSFSIRARFKKIEVVHNEDGSVLEWQIKEMDPLEHSVVSLPCNEKASVLEVVEKQLKSKSFDFLRKERSKNVTKEKKESILEAVKEHLEALLPDKLKELLTEELKPMTEQLSELGEIAKKLAEKKPAEEDEEEENEEEEEQDTSKAKKKKRKKPCKDEADDDEEEEQKEIPDWAKSLADTISGIKEQVDGLTSKRKGGKPEDEEEEEDDSGAPKKALKGPEDEASMKYCQWVMNTSEGNAAYEEMEKSEKRRVKEIWYAALNEGSKVRQ